MKCSKCGCESKLVEALYDERSGAMFITRDTSRKSVCLWPASLGIKKYEGCVEFGRGIDTNTARGGDWSRCAIMALSLDDCEELYGDFPEQEEAWLVIPDSKPGAYTWKRVEHKLALL